MTLGTLRTKGTKVEKPVPNVLNVLKFWGRMICQSNLCGFFIHDLLQLFRCFVKTGSKSLRKNTTEVDPVFRIADKFQVKSFAGGQPFATVFLKFGLRWRTRQQ
jgi:hypothetical protein